MNQTRTLIYALAAGTLVAAPINAHDKTITAAVDHRDLDLTTAGGAAELKGRVKIALLRLCGRYDRTDEVGERPFRRCLQSARPNPTVEAIVTQARLNSTTKRDTRVAVKSRSDAPTGP